VVVVKRNVPKGPTWNQPTPRKIGASETWNAMTPKGGHAKANVVERNVPKGPTWWWNAKRKANAMRNVPKGPTQSAKLIKNYLKPKSLFSIIPTKGVIIKK
jgi:hypothetical protein